MQYNSGNKVHLLPPFWKNVAIRPIYYNQIGGVAISFVALGRKSSSISFMHMTYDRTPGQDD